MPSVHVRSGALPPPLPPLAGLDAEHISALHWEAMGQPGWPRQRAALPHGLLQGVAENHRCNALLWEHQEALGHAPQREDRAALLQALEDCNRRRNDAIAALDEALLAALPPPEPGAPPPAESVGALVDRLSINALKIFHLGLQLQRPDACEAQLGGCADKLAQLRLQRAQLMYELDELLRRLAAGELSGRFDRSFRPYRDPVLDPCAGCAS